MAGPWSDEAWLKGNKAPVCNKCGWTLGDLLPQWRAADGTNIVDKAKEFAENAHFGQVRKYNGEPYVEHPARVAGAVCELVATPAMVAAAWLHDVVEDTPASLDDVRCVFGNAVADLVGWLTNPSKGLKVSRAEKKRIDREHLTAAPREAKIIKMLDRLDNLSGMEGASSEFKDLYGRESLLLAEAVGDADPKLKAALVAAASALCTKKPSSAR